MKKLLIIISVLAAALPASAQHIFRGDQHFEGRVTGQAAESDSGFTILGQVERLVGDSLAGKKIFDTAGVAGSLYPILGGPGLIIDGDSVLLRKSVRVALDSGHWGTRRYIDSLFDAIPSGGSGITKIGQGWGLSAVNDSTSKVDSSKVASLQALKDTAGAVRASISALQADLGGDISGKLDASDTSAHWWNVQPDWGQSDASADDYVKNKPDLGAYVEKADSGTTYVTPAGLATAISGVNVLPDVPIQSYSSTTYTAAMGDKNHIVVITQSSPVAATIPPNSSVAFPVGTVLEFVQGGSGKITFAGGSGVTLGNPHSFFTTAGQYAIVAVRKIDTNTWVLFGDLEE